MDIAVVLTLAIVTGPDTPQQDATTLNVCPHVETVVYVPNQILAIAQANGLEQDV
jgi:hypothetical protein